MLHFAINLLTSWKSNLIFRAQFVKIHLLLYPSIAVSITSCKIAASPLLTHWRYCRLAQKHRYYVVICVIVVCRRQILPISISVASRAWTQVCDCFVANEAIVANTAHYRYLAVLFLQRTQKRYPITGTTGELWGVFCESIPWWFLNPFLSCFAQYRITFPRDISKVCCIA